jgi:hypothetical protein
MADFGMWRSATILEACALDVPPRCAGADRLVIDTAQGHSQALLDQVARVRQASNKIWIIAGNVATADGAEAPIDAGRMR